MAERILESCRRALRSIDRLKADAMRSLCSFERREIVYCFLPSYLEIVFN